MYPWKTGALPHLSRRRWLKSSLVLGAGALLKPGAAWTQSSLTAPGGGPMPGPPVPQPGPLTPEDDALLHEVEVASFQFFWEQANPNTGLVKDRCNVQIKDEGIVSSIAATGFGLTALCIGDQRGFVSTEAAEQQIITTLKFLLKKVPNHRGFFYHWANVNTGERIWDSEVSSVDTAILLCGILTCREHFKNDELTSLANQVFNRVDWTWLSEDTTLLPHGWTPEMGFLPYRWDYYSELMMMYLLGLGSGAHPLADDAWNAWKRLTFEYDGMRYIGSFAPLFVHQFSQAWFDFRHKRDKYADYFENSIIATDVHRRFCIELNGQFPDYSDDLWGISASDSAKGYVIWGGPPSMGPIDGTITPCAAGGSVPFMPEATMRVLHTIRNKYPAAWTKYGFADAFNPLTNWYDNAVVGIDTGITMIMAENARTGFVWDTFMRSEEARRGMARAGLKPY